MSGTPGSTPFEFRPLTEWTSADIAAAAHQVFRDSILAPPPSYDGIAFERRFHSEHLDRTASYVLVDGSEPVALVLVSRRGWTVRIATLAVAPHWRGRGVARALLDRVISDARARDAQRVLVEVLEDNAPAIHRYRSCGFTVYRRLVGYFRTPCGGHAPFEDVFLVETDAAVVADRVAIEGPGDLPWLLQPASISAFDARGYSFAEKAYAVARVSDSRLTLLAFVVTREHRRQGWGRRLVHALDMAFPGREWLVLPYVPDGLVDSFLTSVGCTRSPQTQYEMRLHLRGPDSVERESESSRPEARTAAKYGR